MPKLVLNDITSGYASITALNDNFALIENALENTLSRDGTTPNQMGANLDMNGYLILNQANPVAISGFEWNGDWATATVYAVGDIVYESSTGTAYICVVAHTSGTFATDLAAVKWQVFASASLPPQTAQAAKFLQTNGTSASWEVPEASEVSFTPSGTGAVATNVQSKLREFVSVKDFGAVGDGVTDDSAAFQLAANYAASRARDYNQTAFAAVNKAPTAEVYVPDDNYVVNTAITSTAQIVWNFASNAVVNSTALLTGVINREGRHINARHTGITENSTTLSLRANQALDTTGGVYGITSLAQMSEVGPPHSVTLQIDNDTRTYPTLTGTTYTATTVTYTNAPDLSDVKTGSIITTLGAPNYMGQITNIDTDTKTITVSAWYSFTGTYDTTGIPANGTDAAVDYYEKIWGQNTNVFFRPGNPTRRAAGYELGVLNYQSDVPPLDLAVEQNPSMWGFDAVNLGTYKSSVAFIARAGNTQNWHTGFVSQGNDIGLQIFGKSGHTSNVGVSYEVGTGIAFRTMVSGDVRFLITATGAVEMGSKTVANTPYIDFNSSGLGYDYDARIIAAGGSGALGQGELLYYAGAHRFFGSTEGVQGEALRVAAPINTVNYVQINGSDSGRAPAILTNGTDTNIDLLLAPKGTGVVRFGTWTSNADVAINGYVTIKDASGTIRKLATIA